MTTEHDELLAREEAEAYKNAWLAWRSLQSGDVQKMCDAAIRCEVAEARLREVEDALQLGIDTINFHDGHGTPTVDRAAAELFSSVAIRALAPDRTEAAPAIWNAHDNSGMRYPEESDISGGETDAAPAAAPIEYYLSTLPSKEREPEQSKAVRVILPDAAAPQPASEPFKIVDCAPAVLDIFVDRLLDNNGINAMRIALSAVQEAMEEHNTEAAPPAINADTQDAKEKANAEIGRCVRNLVNGSKFDLTDSPQSFIDNCKQFVVDADTLIAQQEGTLGQFDQDEINARRKG
jgi:hypothetical protein